MFAYICSCKREGKDNESRIAIATKRKVTPHPQMFLGKCSAGFGHVGCWSSVPLEPWEEPNPHPSARPPSLPLPAYRRIDCRCSTSLSSVCVLWGDHRRAGPGFFHPRPESSTLPSIGWKGSYWEFSPGVVREEIQSPSVCLIMSLYTYNRCLKSVSLSFSSCLSMGVHVRWACEWFNNPNVMVAGVYFRPVCVQ